MPRITLDLDQPALSAARRHATRHHQTLDRAVSDLVLRGACRPLLTGKRNDLTVPLLDRRSPRVPARRIAQLRDEQP